MAEDERGVVQLRQSIEGQLLKFTNVMKGFQPRWVVLDAERSVIEYYEKGELRRTGHKARGTLHLFGAAIYPSDEDSQTFTIHASGPGNELFRLKAADAKERQRWITHLRMVSEHSQPHSFVPLSDYADVMSPAARSLSDLTPYTALQIAGGSQPHHRDGPASQAMQAAVPTAVVDSGAPAGAEQSEAPVITDVSNGGMRNHLVELIDRMSQECELTSAHICALPAPDIRAPSFTGNSGLVCDAVPSLSIPSVSVEDGEKNEQPETPVRSLDCLDRDLLLMKATIRAAIASVKECLQLLDARKTPSKPDSASPHYLNALRTRSRTVAKMGQATSPGQVGRLSAAAKTRVLQTHNCNTNATASFDASELESTEPLGETDTVHFATHSAPRAGDCLSASTANVAGAAVSRNKRRGSLKAEAASIAKSKVSDAGLSDPGC